MHNHDGELPDGIAETFIARAKGETFEFLAMTYIGNEQHWKRLIEVDWLGQYVKAWVAFNAWYSNNFAQEGDRAIIEEIKNGGGGVCPKIEIFLAGTGLEQKSFQSDFADLHKSLTDVVVESQEKKTSIVKRISLETIEDYRYAKNIKETKNNITYEVVRDLTQKIRTVSVKNSAGTEIFKEKIKREEEWEAMLNQGGWASSDGKWFRGLLSPPQRKNLGAFLKESSPIHNLLSGNGDSIEIGGFKFVDDKTLIARALIETLYQLRNVLFHGEITPNTDAQRVYQPAYLVLKRIIPGA